MLQRSLIQRTQAGAIQQLGQMKQLLPHIPGRTLLDHRHRLDLDPDLPLRNQPQGMDRPLRDPGQQQGFKLIGQQCQQGFLDLQHAEIWQQGSIFRPPQLVAKMKVCHGKPALPGMHQRPSAVEQHLGGDVCSGKAC